MKKFIVIFILLIIAAGAVFYFGMVNVKPGTFVIALSTLTGIVNRPLESGELNWVWQKLVPKGFFLYEIKKEPYRVQFDLSFPLPGSEELKEYGDFNLGVRGTIQYSVDFEAAETLLDRGLITKFDDYFRQGFQKQAEDRVTGFILDSMGNYSLMTQRFDYASLELLRTTLRESITDYAMKYGLKDLIMSLSFSEIPQIEGYKEALGHYMEYMETLSRLSDERAKKEAEHQITMAEIDAEIARLKKYGELISQYPLLLKYFYIQKFGDKMRVLVLPESESTGFPKMLEPEEETTKKTLIPMEEMPPVEPEIKEESGGGAKEEQPASPEKPIEDTQKEKWYKYLEFWKYITKQ
jgi:hypothetical protein